MTQNEPKVWLVTGGSQGLGLSLVLAALRRGHKVLATARQPEKARSSYPEIEKLGGIWVELDISKSDTQSRVDAAIREHGGGKIDVLVNNAGYNLVSTVEDTLDEEMLDSLQTHIMGPHRVIKAVLPYMRAQKSGTVAFNSSIFALRPIAAQVGYSTVKAAVDMMMETLRLELKHYNIRTLNINSGLFYSGILSNATFAKGGLAEHYMSEGSVLAACMPTVMQCQADPLSVMRGDPAKWGERVVDVVDKSGDLGGAMSDATRLFLGLDSIVLAEQHIERLKREVEQSREIAATTDLDGTKATGVEYLAEHAP